MSLVTLPTIVEAIQEGAHRLQAAGVAEDRRTAGVLLGHALGLDRTRLLTQSNEAIDESRYEQYLQMIERRAAGEPLQYVTGHQEFYGLDFMVTPAVLIPRPETEFLIERTINLARETRLSAPLIVDVGTGSGCIAVTLAVNLPNARVMATDISSDALEVARANAARHGVAERIEFLAGDLFAPLVGCGLESAIDIVASNPPYVAEGKPELIQREVRDWEPAVALFGGADGLNFYRRLLVDGSQVAKPGGYLVCEIGYTQLDAIGELIAASSWQLMDVTHDLQGIPRTLAVKKV